MHLTPSSPSPFYSVLVSTSTHGGFSKARRGGEGEGRKQWVPPSCMQGDPGLVATLAWQGMGFFPPALCSTHTFFCKGVRCHLATVKPSHLEPKNWFTARMLPHSCHPTPERWRKALTLHLSVTWGLTASIPPSAADGFG